MTNPTTTCMWGPALTGLSGLFFKEDVKLEGRYIGEKPGELNQRQICLTYIVNIYKSVKKIK